MTDQASITSSSSNASTTVATDHESTKTPQGSSPSAAVVTKLSSNDVLMGRGAAVIGNEGNRRFRKLIQKYKAAYDATRIRQEKDRIARKIVDTIVSRSGRFLKKIETPAAAAALQVPAGKTAWVIVKEVVVLQKVKQAFRDDRRSFDDDRQGGSNKNGLIDGIPAAFKASTTATSLKTQDSLLGDTSLAQAALLMRTAGATPLSSATGLFPQQVKSLSPSQLEAQLLLLVAAQRQQQQQQQLAVLDPLAAALYSANNTPSPLLDDRTLLLRQALLARQAAEEQQHVAAMRQATSLREQLALLRSSNSGRGASDTTTLASLLG